MVIVYRGGEDMLDKLKAAISEKNIRNAREILKNEFVEKSYSEDTLNNAIELAENYNIFDVSDNEKLLKDSSMWDKRYLEKLKAKLDSNFSKERLVNAYYVARKLRKEKADNGLSNIHLCNEYKDFYSGVKVGACLIGAAVTTVIGAVLIRKFNKRK